MLWLHDNEYYWEQDVKWNERFLQRFREGNVTKEVGAPFDAFRFRLGLRDAFE